MGARTHSAGWGCFAAEVVAPKSEALGVLGASIETKVFWDLEEASEEDEAFQGSVDIGVPNYGHSQR